MSDIEFESRRAAHRRGHSVPMRDRAKVDRSFDDTSVVDVADFVPVGGSLDTHFEQALKAAIVEAYSRSGSPEDGQQGACNVRVPAGKWDLSTMTEPIRFPGSYPKYTPGLVAAGDVGSVIFTMPQDLYPWVEIGTNNPSEPTPLKNYASNQLIEGIEFRPLGGVARRGGIRTFQSINSTFRDVHVVGLGLEGSNNHSKWNECVAFDFEQPLDINGNIQHLRMERCYADLSLVGYRFGRTLWMADLYNCYSNGCLVAPAMYESGAQVSWHGGNTQGGGALNVGTYWFERTPPAVHCTGASYVTGMPSGSGATLSAPSGVYCTLTGLTGLVGSARGASATNKGDWIELTATTPGTPDLISGLYRIEEVLSATSCTIRKGSGAGGSVSYQVRTGGGGQNISLRSIYHEGGAYALASFGTDYQGGLRLSIDSCESNNVQMVVESTGGNSSNISVSKTPAPGGLSGKIRMCRSFTTDQDISIVDSDTASLSGLICRKKGVVRDARPRESRYNRALVERGAFFAVDARKSDSFVLSGANVTSWTDFIGGVVGAKINAGVPPQYVASDAGLAAPAVQMIGGSDGATVGGLTWSVASKMRAKCGGTIIVVARLPDTTVPGVHRMVTLHTDNFDVTTHWNDGIYYAGGGIHALAYDATIGGGAQSALTGAKNTLAQVCLAASFMFNPSSNNTSGSCGSGASDTVDYADNGNLGSFGYREIYAAPTNALIMMPRYIAGSPGNLFVSHIAAFDRGVTTEEAAGLIDLIRNEFNVSKV